MKSINSNLLTLPDLESGQIFGQKNKHFQEKDPAHLVNMKISDLQELIPIFCDLRDCNVELQILDWKITKVLDL